MKNLDVDKVISFVNKLIDNVRCATCDKLEGTRVRYQCGHIACDDCVIYAQDCLTCISPSERSDTQPKYDKQLTQMVKSAVDLLKACISLFDANAFQRKRISEQLRIEKELFPNCIQAPVKYENKRKSSLNTNENRHSTFFPGEEVTSVIDMANTTNYVHQWLRNNETNLGRKPFSDLNVNTTYGNKNKNLKQNVGENIFLGVNRKRTYSKTADEFYSHKGNIKSVYKCDNTPKKVKRKNASHIKNKNSTMFKKCDNDESGIFMENETIVICDSQETVIDKDKNAWLSVLKACEHEDLESTSLVNVSPVNSTNDSSKQMTNFIPTEAKGTSVVTVPFFKKSAIIETCKYCNSEVSSDKPVTTHNQIKPVKIAIDGDSFLTTITICQNVEGNKIMKTQNTIAVQTDISEVPPINKDNCEETNKYITNLALDKIVNACDDGRQSQDLFANDNKVFGFIGQSEEVSKCLVIQESESDTDLEVSGTMSVKADVHRSCEESELGILNSVFNVKKHESKPRRRPRGHTPTSTDSSEKENYNPNRIKRLVTGKKKCTKK